MSDDAAAAARLTDGPALDILLFAAVPDASMLEQGFYAAEAEGLRAHPAVGSVHVSNRIADVRKARYDGLVSYFYSHSALTAGIARLRGKPVVVTGGGEQVFRGTMSSGINYALRLAAFQLTTVLANRILATSTTDMARMQAIGMVGRRKIELSYHGAPAADHFAPANLDNPRRFGALVTICGMDTEQNLRRKGVFEALALLARFVAVCPDATLTIIGRTTCQSLVEERARELGLLSHVRFAGYVTEDRKLGLLRESRFYVQLSEYEGFGIGALEAMAEGCHVIHTGVGGLVDTVGEFGTVLSRDGIEHFDPRLLPEYRPDPRKLAAHLRQFGVRRRADAILAALLGGDRPSLSEVA